MTRRKADVDASRESLRQVMDNEGVCVCDHWRREHAPATEPWPIGGPFPCLAPVPSGICACKGYTYSHSADSHRGS